MVTDLNLKRRQKYKNSGRTVSHSDRKIDVKFDISALTSMCSYVISENKNIRRGHLINMRNLFEIIDLDYYANDPEKMRMISFIRKGLEGKILHGLKEPSLIVKYINGGIAENDLVDIKMLALLSNEELQWINSTIEDSLKYAYIYNDVDYMIDICTRFKAADYRTRKDIVDEFQTLVGDIQTKFRRARVESLSELSFCLRQGPFEEAVQDVHDQLSNPNNKLVCGMQGLNELFGGGFESTRVYMLLGLTGVGKSITLLNLAYQMKKYNRYYKPKDPTKIPVILYMTMENTVKETVERLFDMTVGKGEMTDYTAEEVSNLLRTEGELYLSDESPIDILIKFVPDRSVDTSYLYTMVEDLEDEGYEVICLIQDHIKKIRSCFQQNDIRLELGSIVNEFKVFSSIKNIPVITNSHLNRDAARTIDEGSKANKADLTRMLGRQNIGESMLMLDNLDGACLIGLEYDKDGNKFMAFNRIKFRGKASIRNYMCQPFFENGIRLMEDYDSPVPLFKDTMKETLPAMNIDNGPIKVSQYENINSIDDLLNDNKAHKIYEENIFDIDSLNKAAIEAEKDILDDETIAPSFGKRHEPKPIEPLRKIMIKYNNNRIA